VRFDGKLFGLTPKVLELGYAYLSGLTLPGIAGPHLEALVARVHESSSMSVLDHHDIVYVARVPTARIMTVAINVGTRFPAYATSMGRVLLAGLDEVALDAELAAVPLERFTEHTVRSTRELRARIEEVRRDGYAMVDQELESGLRSIAVPVRDKQGRVVAAINVSSHVSRITKERARKEFLPPLLRAAEAIERDLART
jgi:IclR family pca regulon transcriptional regulator